MKLFFKQLFCLHDYEYDGFDDVITGTCSKCRKEITINNRWWE